MYSPSAAGSHEPHSTGPGWAWPPSPSSCWTRPGSSRPCSRRRPWHSCWCLGWSPGGCWSQEEPGDTFHCSLSPPGWGRSHSSSTGLKTPSLTSPSSQYFRQKCNISTLTKIISEWTIIIGRRVTCRMFLTSICRCWLDILPVKLQIPAKTTDSVGLQCYTHSYKYP